MNVEPSRPSLPPKKGGLSQECSGTFMPPISIAKPPEVTAFLSDIGRPGICR